MPDVVIPNMAAAPAIAAQNMPGPPNLLGMAANAVGVKNAMLQGQNLQNALTEFKSRQAAGQDFQKSFNPLTGQFDQTTLNSNLAGDPNAALAAPQMSQQGLQNLQAQLQAKGISQSNAIQRLTWGANAAGELLNKPGGPTIKDVRSMFAQGIADGVFSAKDAAQALTQVPTDPKQLDQWIRTHYASAQASIQALTPHIAMANNGEYQFGYNVNPMAPGGIGPRGGAFPNQLSPGQAASPTSYTGPQGQPITTTLGQIYQNGNQLPGAQPGAGAITGPTQQESAANAQTGAAAGQMVAQTFGDLQTIAQSRAALTGIQAELGSANPGPLAGNMAKIGAAVGQLGIKGIDQSSAYQLLQKGSAQLLVSQVSNGLGVPTDSKMGEVLAGTPNGTMSPLAIQGASAMISGALDYKQAEADAALKAGVANNPASAMQFKAQWTQRFPNAAVFQFSHLPGELQKKYWASMPQAQRKAFFEQYNSAAASGFVPPDPFQK